MAVKAGLIIEDDTGETKVNADMMNVAAHFLFIVQFFGFAGSLGPSHVTCPDVKRMHF